MGEETYDTIHTRHRAVHLDQNVVHLVRKKRGLIIKKFMSTISQKYLRGMIRSLIPLPGSILVKIFLKNFRNSGKSKTKFLSECTYPVSPALARI